MINIEGLNKADVLRVLWDRAGIPGSQGMDVFLPGMSQQAAEQHVQFTPSLDFDYLGGKPMKVNISGDQFDEWLYDREHGAGAAQHAIDTLRS